MVLSLTVLELPFVSGLLLVRRLLSEGGSTGDNGVMSAEVDVDEEDGDPDDGDDGEDDDGGARAFFSRTPTALSTLATAVWTLLRLAVRVAKDRLSLSLSASSFTNLVSVFLEASSSTEILEAKTLS